MAYVYYQTCYACGDSFLGVDSMHCHLCSEIIEETNKREALAKRRFGKTLQQRVEQIEEWIYEYEKYSHSHNNIY